MATSAARMNPAGLFCKSFRRDVDRFGRLLESVLAHDRDRLPFVLSVPEDDRSLFAARYGNAGGRLEIVTDESYADGPVVQSWRGQQVVKLHSWKLRFASAWMLLDSDFCFVRPFGAADLVGPSGVPRFVVSRRWHLYEPSNEALLLHLRGEATLPPLTREELAAWRASEPFAAFGAWRVWWDKLWKRGLRARVDHVRRVLRRPGPELFFMPGPIWSVALHERFHDEFLRPRGLRYRDLIRLSPWEYNWVGEWRVAVGLEESQEPMEPPFLHFDSDEAIAHARAQGFTTADFAKRYLGLALASGHQLIEQY